MQGETDLGEIRSTYSAVPSQSTATSPTHATSYALTSNFTANCPTYTFHLLSQPRKTGLATRSNTPLTIASKIDGVATSKIACYHPVNPGFELCNMKWGVDDFLHVQMSRPEFLST